MAKAGAYKDVRLFDEEGRKTFLQRMQEAEAKIMAEHDATPKWQWVKRRQMRRLAAVAGGRSLRSVKREG